jgi:hypothetical protein
MTATEVKNYLSNLVSHLLFTFNDIECGIDPLASDNYEMWYGNETFTAHSIDEVMNVNFFDGKSMNEIVNLAKFD